MKRYLSKVKDMWNIYKRIKNINPNYELYFNLVNKKYEVHDKNNFINSLCLTFSKLEPSILVSLHKTKRENMKKLFQEIEEKNEMLSMQKQEEVLDKASNIMSEILSFADKSSRDLSQYEIKQIIHKLGD